MAWFGNLLQQAMEKARAQQGGAAGGMQGRPVYQPGISPAQQSFMQRYGGYENVRMADGSPQVIPQSFGNQYAGQSGYLGRMQRYQKPPPPPPQQSQWGSYGGTFGGPSGQQGKIQMPPDQWGGFGQTQGLTGPWQGDPRNNPMTRGRGRGLDPRGPHARLAGNMTSGLRNMMRQNRMKRRNQPTGGGGGTLTRRRQPSKNPTMGTQRGLGGIIKKRPRNQGPVKGGLLGKTPTKNSQRGAFEGILR